ncbi:hypothetical protein [Hyalangium versicolor]|uniref:hypothetical protein n=1 Tax=Hyalangium versicolor TaxID=2861190 RepID=UPI001CD01C01|nr:hypothetical protein [Hyalangium versicolor]
MNPEMEGTPNASTSVAPSATQSFAPWTDTVARFTGEGPLYFKAVDGVAVTPRHWLPPRLRAGGEVGGAAISRKR